MAVDTSAIVRRYWTPDSRLAWVSSRARTASRSVETDRSSRPEIASASGASGAFASFIDSPSPAATSFLSRSMGRTTYHSSSRKLPTASTASPTAAPTKNRAVPSAARRQRGDQQGECDNSPPEKGKISARHPCMMGSYHDFRRNECRISRGSEDHPDREAQFPGGFPRSPVQLPPVVDADRPHRGDVPDADARGFPEVEIARWSFDLQTLPASMKVANRKPYSSGNRISRVQDHLVSCRRWRSRPPPSGRGNPGRIPRTVVRPPAKNRFWIGTSIVSCRMAG